MNTLGIFTKYWQAGQVKTRLGVAIGNQQSCEIQRCFFDCLQRRFRKTADDRVIVVWPPHAEAQFVDSVDPNWRIGLQADGDLGSKMANFFAAQFERGADKVVLIGSDCPHLETKTVQNAFARLDDNDLVFGPTTDGGYYLIGMKMQLFDVFEDVEWSTSQVLSQTLERIELNNQSYALLPPNFDVDTESDLQKFLELDVEWTDRETIASVTRLQTEVRQILND